jgi:DNA polymerase-1
MKFAPIDFEYTGTAEKNLKLVCCSVLNKDFWLFNNPKRIIELDLYLRELVSQGYILLSYNYVAEAGAIISMETGLDPVDIKTIDLFLEYRMLLNHNHDIAYGEQLIKGKVKKTKPPLPKWQMTEELKKKSSFDEPEENLAACVFKLLGVMIDTEEKRFIRDIIIEGNPARIEMHKQRIMKYCRSDIQYLEPIYHKIVEKYVKYLGKSCLANIGKQMLGRARYAALTAHMERRGYPVNVEAMQNFSNSVPQILDSCIRDINSQFPNPPFKWNHKETKWSVNQVYLKSWIRETQDVNSWMKTDSKDISLSLDAWTNVFNFSHDYPRNNLGAQIVRYLKLKQQLNGFTPKKNSRTIWDSTGKDGRVRPYMNIFGAQSSRSQPSSTSFIPLKSAWMRVLIEPLPGKAIATIDYSSQEFLVAALDSGDKVMIDAYHSGDPYLYFGKEAKMIPQDGTKQSHPLEREKAKGTTLSMQYGTTEIGLVKKLTIDTGIPHTVDDARLLIHLFDTVFNVMVNNKEELYEEYLAYRYLQLDDGWTMFGDNRNERSVKNVRTQGKGAVIMRKAVELCHKRGLKVIFTLHDALYIEYDSHDFAAVDTLRECMDEAFKFYYRGFKYESLANIRMDAFSWSPDYKEETIKTPKGHKLDLSNLYVDERSINEYNFFKKYFSRNEDLDLV